MYHYGINDPYLLKSAVLESGIQHLTYSRLI